MKFPGGRAVTTSSQDSTFKPRKPTFLSLPAEIRLCVYKFYFSSQLDDVVRFEAEKRYWCYLCGDDGSTDLADLESYSVTKQEHHISNLLRACKHIAREASPIAGRIRPIFSLALPYAGRDFSPWLPQSFAQQVRTVEISSRGIPSLHEACDSVLKSKTRRGPHWRDCRRLEHVQEVMIHSHTSLPIQVRSLGHEITKLCESDAAANAHQGLLQRCVHQAQVALFSRGDEQEYDEGLFRNFVEVLGDRVVKIRCSLYEPACEEKSNEPDPEDGIWVCQVSGVSHTPFLLYLNLRTHD